MGPASGLAPGSYCFVVTFAAAGGIQVVLFDVFLRGDCTQRLFFTDRF